jgi:diguanylate cyclase (GGDEF)-like protein
MEWILPAKWFTPWSAFRLSLFFHYKRKAGSRKTGGVLSQAMSMRILIAGCSLGLFAAIVGCIVIARSRQADRSLWWLVGALSSAFAGSLLFAGQSFIPAFFTIILANEAVLVSFALLHQAIAAVLESPRRHTGMSVLLVAALFLAFLYFTYASPDIRARTLVRTAALMIQTTVSAVVLFRHKDLILYYPIRIAAWALTAFSMLQISRLAATLVWAPLPDRLHPDSIQASYAFFDYILGLGSCFSVIWLALSAQRHHLQIMATTDGLSGLMNRRTFDEILEREIRSGRAPMALMLIDLDHFKSINDSYGHQMGDEVIRRVGQLLCLNTRTMDIVARYGGEEFAMILKGMPVEQVESIGERLRTQIEAMAGLPEPIRVTASIGIAMQNIGDTVTSLLKRSDEALYLSKRSGRNRVSTQYALSRMLEVSGDLYLT